MSEKTTASKYTQAGKEVRKFMKGTYSRAREAKERGEKIAWGMRGVPVEPLRALGILVCWPEPYTSLFSAKRLEAPMLDKARADGFSRFSSGTVRQAWAMPAPLLRREGFPKMLLTAACLCRI